MAERPDILNERNIHNQARYLDPCPCPFLGPLDLPRLLLALKGSSLARLLLFALDFERFLTFRFGVDRGCKIKRSAHCYVEVPEVLEMSMLT